MRTKKLLAMALVVVMILTSGLSVMADTTTTTTTTTPTTLEKRPVFRNLELPKLENDLRNSELKDGDQVRIIVQLDSEPLAEYAIKSGVKVNQLSTATVTTVTEDLYSTQETVKKDIQQNGIDIEYHDSFINIINGFSGTTTYGSAKEIELLPGVKQVSIAHEYMRPEPDMLTSIDIVNAPETWTYGLKGTGMVVAIVDTGIDPSHKDMKLTDVSTAKLDQAEVNALITQESLNGKFFTDKVPYGYNYYDNNQEIRDLGPGASMHGMHVGGTVAANGDATGIKGVAPEAQLLAMKVFSNDPGFPSTFGDMIIKAIDDSVKLGADVINMSLGSTASYVMPDDPEQQAVTRAANAGVLLSISAGNSDKFGAGWPYAPYNTNPDVGVVGSPGLTAESLQVASVENSHINAYVLEFTQAGVANKAPYFAAGPTDPLVAFEGKTLEYVDCKFGLIGTMTDGTPKNDFAGVNVAGKIALIKRGGYTGIAGNFVDKIANAYAAGAAGVIVWNNEGGGDGLISMAYPTGITDIPAVFIGNSYGAKLLAMIGTADAKIQFKGNQQLVVNPSANKMSTFTSWGPTPDLEFKPEITAPGGQIYSTFNDNKYGMMSGTSMAAPHVAGGSALMMQKVAEKFPTLTGLDKVNMAKNMLMSTAHPLTDKGTYNAYYGTGSYYSPRSQGAGVMDLFAAVNTPAVVFDKTTGLSKVNLKEIGDNPTFTVVVNNFGDQPVTYNVSGNVQTDLVRSSKINNVPTLLINHESELVFDSATYDPNTGVGQFPISFEGLAEGGSITLAAGETKELKVTLDLANAIDWFNEKSLKELFPNGTFVEGFVQLEAADDTTPDLSIPYVGFYGEWDKAPIIDGDTYGLHGKTFYDYTGMLFRHAEGYDYIGQQVDGKVVLGFSPNGDDWADNVLPILSFLRNAKEVNFDIYDATGTTKLVHLATENNMRKHFFDGDGPIYTFRDNWTWDGTVNNKLAADGNYIYRITSTIDYEGATPQVVDFPIVLDTVSPTIVDYTYNKDTYQLVVNGNDGDNKLVGYVLLDMSNPSEALDYSVDGTFDLTLYKNQVMNLQVIAQDQAYNVAITEPFFINDNQIASIYLENPEPFTAYNTNEIDFNGYITDQSGLESLKINGQDVEFAFDAETGRYMFETAMTFADGMHIIDIDALDKAGNAINFERTIYIDTNGPAITMTQEPTTRIVENTVDKVSIAGEITDIFNFLRVKVNGNEVFVDPAEEEYADKFTTPISYALNQEVALALGENIITVSAQDYAGNMSTKQYKVYRKAAGEADPDLGQEINLVSTNFQNITNVSSDRPITISATANQEVNWTVTIKNPTGAVETTLNHTGIVFEKQWAPPIVKKLNGEYSIEISIEKDGKVVNYGGEAQYKFTVYNYPVLINSVNVVKQNGYVAVEAEIFNLGPSATNPMLIVQVLDENGYVVNISTARMNGLLNNQTISLSSGFGLTRPGTYTADVFVWTGWTGTQALSSPKTITFTID